MTGSPPPPLAVGRGALRQLHASLESHAPEHAIAVLQEAGYAAGEATYRAFAEWLPERAGVSRPEDLDAELLNDVLSDFFAHTGWGTLAMSPVGTGALAVDSPDWAEAEPGSAESPMCFFSAGMLADFLGRLSGEPVAAMEVECRSRGDARCRFLSATPEVLQQVYEQMTQGRSYVEALSG
ncbi:MAG TPA: V4R domain-containing protein [Gemmatimonadales bacterium]|jgi:predicted hydrocarbon binding protein|nr:V4R domain-containing protein [Gemmatimonadales bacterium]